MPKSEIEIIHEDSDIIVINKPPGVSVTSDRSGQQDILPMLARQLQSEQDLRLVHRHDKFTSGVMLVAKTPQAQSRYASWFEKRLIKSTYLALVSGVVTRETATIRTPIAHSRKNPRIMVMDPKRGKPAITHYRLLADFQLYALLAVQPETVRTHQIRVHMASRHFPLAIDPLYGDTRPIMLSEIKPQYVTKKPKKETPLIDRLTLHAYQLEVPTDDGPPAVYVAKLEKKFAAAIKMLAKHNPNGIEAFTDPDDFTKILNSQQL
jgi:RluA family pseudouridine synthase